MAIVDRNTLKNWFLRGMKPLASQFASWIDSFWHKWEKIPASTIEGLQEAFDEKAEKEVVDGLKNQIDNFLQVIENHNSSGDSHEDIRELIAECTGASGPTWCQTDILQTWHRDYLNCVDSTDYDLVEYLHMYESNVEYQFSARPDPAHFVGRVFVTVIRTNGGIAKVKMTGVTWKVIEGFDIDVEGYVSLEGDWIMTTVITPGMTYNSNFGKYLKNI